MKVLGCAIALINSNGQVLLHLRDNNPQIKFPDTWGLPGGHVEEGEDGLTCIKREMTEELGIEVEPRLIYFFDNDGCSKAAYWAKLELDPEKIKVVEGVKYQWFDMEEAQKMKLAFAANQVLYDLQQSLD